MIDEKYLLASKSLAERNKNRLNTELNPKEKEREELFFWILSRLEWSIQGCWPAKNFHSVTVEGYFRDRKYVVLKHGTISQYVSQYVTRNEFLSVIQDVVDIFNKIGNQEEDEYEFFAICFTTDRNIELTVNLTTKR